MKSKGIAIPYVVWMAIFVVAPLIVVLVYAFTRELPDGSWYSTLENFSGMAGYAYVFGRSFLLAFIATVVCILLGYPMAYFLARERGRLRSMATMLIMLPMWMNFLLRTYSWVFLLERNGFFNSLLETIGLPKLDIIDTPGAVVLGMVYNFLPFMVFPIYTVLSKQDPKLGEAAQDLGCNEWRTLVKVTMPLSLPGVISGITMVFMPSVTTFFIPRVLGGGNTVMFGDLIESKFLTEGNWNVGSALSLIMMVLILISLSILRKADPKGEGGGIA